jgi:hypothetical protein
MACHVTFWPPPSCYCTFHRQFTFYYLFLGDAACYHPPSSIIIINNMSLSLFFYPSRSPSPPLNFLSSCSFYYIPLFPCFLTCSHVASNLCQTADERLPELSPLSCRHVEFSSSFFSSSYQSVLQRCARSENLFSMDAFFV